MNHGYDFGLALKSEVAAVCPGALCTARTEHKRWVLTRLVQVWLAVLVALSTLVGLMTGLFIVRDSLAKTFDDPIAQMQNGNGPASIVTKTVEPANPDTGSIVTITFVLTGVGPRSLDVALIQDVSGSMSDAVTADDPQMRLEASKIAAWDFIAQLQPSDWVAVVAYSTTAQLVQPLTTSRGVVSEAIGGLKAFGFTNMSDGLRIASAALLTTSARPFDAVRKVIVLLSDGNANRPEPESAACQRALAEAQIAASKGISIFTIGFGQDANHDLLQSIAEVGRGEYYFAPTSNDLHAAYLSIALRLRNLAIVDVLPPNIQIECPPSLPRDMCVEDPGGDTTVTWPISDDALLGGGPLTVTFTVTVNWIPGQVGPINGSESCLQYNEPGEEPKCDAFVNPPVVVGGRMITGFVFKDLDQDGRFENDEGEGGISSVVTTSNGFAYETDSSGFYIFRTSAERMLSVAIRIPPNHITTTSEVTSIRPSSGTYRWDFGLYPSIDGISLACRAEPYPAYHGYSTTLFYSVTNRDQEDSIVTGTICMVDSLGRTLDEQSFSMGPDKTTPLPPAYFTVPRDVVITLTAVATYDVPDTLPVSDQITETFCPTDIYESDDNARAASPISPGKTQIHDFYWSGDEDWVRLRLYAGDESFYRFTALPLGPDGVQLCLKLHREILPLPKCNDQDYQSPVTIGDYLSCTGADLCDYFLQIYSPSTANGCDTDYEVRVDAITMGNDAFLPIVLRDFHM